MATKPRFLTLADVAEVLNISTSQVYALVRNQELAAIKIGGRGQWRVERDRLEEYIARMYQQTRQFLDQHPFVEGVGVEGVGVEGGGVEGVGVEGGGVEGGGIEGADADAAGREGPAG